MKYKLLLAVVAALSLNGCDEKTTTVPANIQAIRDQHGGATNWLECQQGIVVHVYTEHRGDSVLPYIDPLRQDGSYIRCGTDNVTSQAVEVQR